MGASPYFCKCNYLSAFCFCANNINPHLEILIYHSGLRYDLCINKLFNKKPDFPLVPPPLFLL
jgi:hypothetical protein